MGNIGIAYLNKHGKGYNFLTPFVTLFDLKATKEQVLKEIDRLEKQGCQKITPFTFAKTFYTTPKNIDDLIVTWKQVEERKFDINMME